MQIHSVVSITQLKSVSTNNLYEYKSNTNSSFIKNNVMINKVADNVNAVSFYKIEQLLNKCIICQDHSYFFIQYLVKWKKYNYSHNVWYEVKNLTDASELIENYEKRIHWSFCHINEIIDFVEEEQIVMNRLVSSQHQSHCQIWLTRLHHNLIGVRDLWLDC